MKPDIRLDFQPDYSTVADCTQLFYDPLAENFIKLIDKNNSKALNWLFDNKLCGIDIFIDRDI